MGVCMHIPSLTCENCDNRLYDRWNRERSSDYGRPFRWPSVIATEPCSDGHDYAVGDTRAVCNRCDKVVRL